MPYAWLSRFCDVLSLRGYILRVRKPRNFQTDNQVAKCHKDNTHHRIRDKVLSKRIDVNLVTLSKTAVCHRRRIRKPQNFLTDHQVDNVIKTRNGDRWRDMTTSKKTVNPVINSTLVTSARNLVKL